jgi:hypothetical protein
MPPGQYRGKPAVSGAVNGGAFGADPPSSSSTGSNRMRLADVPMSDVLQLCHAACSFPLEPLDSAGLRSVSFSESHKTVRHTGLELHKSANFGSALWRWYRCSFQLWSCPCRPFRGELPTFEWEQAARCGKQRPSSHDGLASNMNPRVRRAES